MSDTTGISIRDRIEKLSTKLTEYADLMLDKKPDIDMATWLTDEGEVVLVLGDPALREVLLGVVAAVNGYVGVVGYVSHGGEMFIITAVSEQVARTIRGAFDNAVDTLQLVAMKATEKLARS